MGSLHTLEATATTRSYLRDDRHVCGSSRPLATFDAFGFIGDRLWFLLVQHIPSLQSTRVYMPDDCSSRVLLRLNFVSIRYGP